VPFSNEKEVCVRVKKAGTEGLERLAWSDLAFEQYVAFLDFYAQLRLGREGPLGDGASREQRRREAGADYWRVALLCDWYGLGDLAAAHAASAVECDPSLKPLAEALIPSATREADGAEEE
jgi:hypothetical protein